ncbi:MAG: MATE family efflux transporter [Negativicutes bacterium]|nr:MATE family efflux transporter [Negativicutes bacterium]
MQIKQKLAPENRKFLQLFWPVLIEQGLTILVGIFSTILVSNVGDYAVAGVNLVDSINNMIIIFFNALASGATVVVAQRIGARRNQEAGETAAQAIVLVVGIAAVVGLAAGCFAGPILQGLYGKSAANVLQMGRIYLYFSGASYLFLGLSSVCAGVTRAAGNSKTPMIAALLANLINISVAVILIYGFHMGIYAVAVAMLAARISAAAFMLWAVRSRTEGSLVLPKIRLKLDMALIRPILDIGIPSGLDSLIFQGAKVVVAVLLSGMGTAAMQTNAIVGSLSNFFSLPGNAFSIVGVTVVGQSYGAGLYRQTKKLMAKLCLYSSAVMTALIPPFLLLLDRMIASYGPSLESAAQAKLILTICLLVNPLLYPTAFVLPQSLRAVGDAKKTMVISIVSLFGLRLFGSWFLGVRLGYGVLGLWLSMFADWGGRTIGFVYRWKRNRWHHGEEPLDEGALPPF